MPKTKLAPIPTEHLFSIDYVASRLGRGYSRRSQLRRIESGEWIEGVHWIDDRRKGSQRRVIKINIKAISELRSQLAGER